MSQLFTEAQQHGEAITIHAGWDGPLQTAYLSTIRAGEYELSTLLDPETGWRRFSFEDIQQYAQQKGIVASEAFWSRLREHCEGKYGSVRHTV